MRFIIKDPTFHGSHFQIEKENKDVNFYEYKDETFVRYWQFVHYNNRGIRLYCWIINQKVEIVIPPTLFDFQAWKEFASKK